MRRLELFAIIAVVVLIALISLKVIPLTVLGSVLALVRDRRVKLSGYALIAGSVILALLAPSPLLSYIGPINPVTPWLP